MIFIVHTQCGRIYCEADIVKALLRVGDELNRNRRFSFSLLNETLDGSLFFRDRDQVERLVRWARWYSQRPVRCTCQQRGRKR